MSIWNYRFIKNSVDLNKENKITLNEGNIRSDIIELENNSKLYIKREDENPSGSWKDRGTAYKLSLIKSKGINEAVIASSGNAAISFLTYANHIGDFKMHIVVSPDINELKKEIIEKLALNTHKVYFESKAKTFSSKLSSELSIPNLRSAIDDEIVKGYWSLGIEIFQEIIKNYRDKKIVVFIQASSGTAGVGIAQGLQLEIENELKMPRMFFVQTQSCHPLLDENEVVEKSLADAIVDKSMLRKPMLNKIIKETNGGALSITNEEILNAKEYIEKHNINLSNTSLLSVAGFLRVYNNDSDTIFITIASGR